MPTLADLRAERIRLCRLTADRALESVDDAEAFLHDRRMLTLVADSSLPSLFGATHEEPYAAVKAGFGSWPKTKWRWGGELAGRTGVLTAKIHRGKLVFLSREAASIADPLCRESLARAADGELGPEAATIVSHLAAAGPSSVDDLKTELGLDAKTLRSAREKLESSGAVVSKGTVVPAAIEPGHKHSSTLARWDQAFTQRRKGSAAASLDELVVLGVRATVVTHQEEIRTWFYWPVTSGAIEGLVRSGRLSRPAPGWVAAPQ
ncbi:MAG: hypothetical protein A3G84_07515 [Chloroflexi bacterium RIFCSPLOWO2_12_FULL_71_12]|nr:MAG: hypothetical protein A2082_00965 [Chloroflexi bacterium GWC2_70_10]OGO74418.1 MAG: hypothetical protein A3G84_07515 [Chloroflexi bacterium RIFCSPLOWO2_12_FULL_71_12]